MLGTDDARDAGTGRHTEPRDGFDRLRRVVPENGSLRGVTGSVTRYDLVLTIIPAAFVFAMLARSVLALSPRTAMVAASVVAAVALVDALFVNPPRDAR